MEPLVLRAATDVGPMLKENFGKTSYTEKSSDTDWVTEWDMRAEEEIIKSLGKISADIGFLGEESGANGDEDVYWTIDPIDGTSGFVRGIDTCTSMISLVDNGEPVISIINDFVRDIPYTAVAGQGAYKNEVERLQVSDRSINKAYYEAYIKQGTEFSQEFSGRMRNLGAKMLRTGSAGHMFTSIARGSVEAFVSYDNPSATIWDYAPGTLLVSEAGGEIYSIDGSPYSVDSFNFVASNLHTSIRILDAITESEQLLPVVRAKR